MKLPSIQLIPNETNNEHSESELKYMDDCDDCPPSQENLESSPTNLVKHSDLPKEKTLTKTDSVQVKVSKKKPLAKEPKVNASSGGTQMKRVQSQSRSSNLNYTKLYSKKSSEFREVKFSQFELIYKTFNMFSSQYINFNQLVLALKSLGIQIETEKRFQAVKNIYDEFVGKNDSGIDFEMFGKIAIRLLKDQKSKPNSDLIHIEKSYFYMIQEANKVEWPFNKEEEEKFTEKEIYDEFKLHVDCLPSEKRYLNTDSITNLVKYLGMEKEISLKDVEMIVKFAEKEEKGYLSLEDVLKCIHGNKMIDV